MMLPLVCVYRVFSVARNRKTGKIERIVFSNEICGVKAPRNRAKRNQPAFPNRFGEPLCKRHRIYANDELAFPGDPDAIFEEEKTGSGRIDRMQHINELRGLMNDLKNKMDKV